MSDANSRTVTIERTFDAPVELVWKAWTQPDHIAKWWGPPGMPFEVVEHEFRQGGNWKFTMKMPNGGDFISEGTYQEIVEHSKIVTTADFKPMTEGVTLEIHFEADGDKTKFTFNVIHISEEYRKQQEEMGIYNGWGGAFDRLAGTLTS